MIASKYSLSTAYTRLQIKMDRETMDTPQTDGAWERSVWNQRVTTLSLSLKAKPKNIFVVFLSLLIILCLGSGRGVLENQKVRIVLSTYNQTPQEENQIWRNIYLSKQKIQKDNHTWNNLSLSGQPRNQTSPQGLLMSLFNSSYSRSNRFWKNISTC